MKMIRVLINNTEHIKTSTTLDLIVISFVFLLLTSSCGKDSLEDIDDTYNLNDFEEYVEKDQHSSQYIYNQNHMHRFDIYISQQNLDKLNNNPTAEEYVEGSLVFENKIIRTVGVRYKGSFGAWFGGNYPDVYPCLSSSEPFNPSGYKTCPKLSMKIKINWQGDKKFYGLNKLQFHAQNLDPGKMNERLGYYMYRNFGVIAPRSNHAVIYINGEFNGVFANTEQIDGPFTNKNFDHSGGNLYKEIWPITSNGESRSESYFQRGLKTNEEISNVSKIKAFSDQLAAVDPNEAWSIIEQWIDKELFLRTLVVDRRIANDDGFLHFYDEGGLFENHNYYVYEDPDENKLQIIPWDLDNAFENLVENRNPVTPIKDRWYQTTNNCNGFSYGALNLRQKSAACDKIIGSFVQFLDEYNELDLTFRDDVFNLPNINTLLDAWSQQIRDAVIEAHNTYGDQEPSLEEWTTSLEQLKSDINQSFQHWGPN